MKQIRNWKFRIYPSKNQEKELQNYLYECKNIWNNLLEHTKQYYAKTGKFPTEYQLNCLPKKKSRLFSQVAQNVAARLSKAITGMLAKKKKGKKAGFPKFKPLERVKSFTYPQFGFKLEEQLLLSKIGKIQIKKHRKIQGKIKTLAIKKSLSNKWYAVFTSEAEKPEFPKNNKNPQAGMDLGIEQFASFSNGKIIENPRHLKKAEQKLKEAQKLLSKKKKGSKNRRKAKLRVARAYEKVANNRRDFLHKTSRMLVDSYSLIAMEDLNVAGLSKGFLAKHVLDCSWAEFNGMLHYKAEEAGCVVILVNPAYTSQECSSCGLIQKKTLAERQHKCPCGADMHRDLNAAKNILKRSCNSGCKRSERSSLRANRTLKQESCWASPALLQSPTGGRRAVPVEKGPLPEKASPFDESGKSICEDGSPVLLETKVSREETNGFSD